LLMRAQGTESKNSGETKEKISLRVKAAEKGFFHIASKSSYGHENQYTKRFCPEVQSELCIALNQQNIR